MIPLSEAVERIYSPFANRVSTPEIRTELTRRLNIFFAMMQEKGYAVPVDFTICIAKDGGTDVFFAKDFTEVNEI